MDPLRRDDIERARRATIVEQEVLERLGTVRLASPTGFVVDLLAASCGIEPEIVEAATKVDFKGVGSIPVAKAEDLLAMKLLSAPPGRERDWNDARGWQRRARRKRMENGWQRQLEADSI